MMRTFARFGWPSRPHRTPSCIHPSQRMHFEADVDAKTDGLFLPEQELPHLSRHYVFVAFSRWSQRPLPKHQRLTEAERVMWGFARVDRLPIRLEVVALEAAIPTRVAEARMHA